jgi:kynureninase
MTDRLEAWRAEFPILQRKTYLNSCSLGALSGRSMAYLAEFQELWNELGASAWYELWMGRIEELRARVAGLLAAEEAEVALSPSVSAALSSIASAVDHARRPRVVVAELDFPTLAYQWLAKPGVEVVRVPSDDGVGIDLARWAEAIDERTAVVATSHVFYSTGAIQPLAPLGELARRAGALFVVDGYQAMGQIPVHPRGAGADVYVAGPLKWMLGGPGLAYLWVRRELVPELRPTIASWFGARDQFRFEVDRLELRDDASRFAMGTPAMPTVYTALGGAEIVAEVGIERIRRRVSDLTEELVRRALAAGMELRVAGSAAERSGIVMVRAGDARGAVRALAEEGIVVDSRGDFVRVSPHFYNNAEEVERVVEALARTGR